MPALNIEKLREAIHSGRIEWRKHVTQRLAERGLAQATVLQVLLVGEKIRDYEEDKPFASALFLGYAAGRPVHVVVSMDTPGERAFIITVYEPSDHRRERVQNNASRDRPLPPPPTD